MGHTVHMQWLTDGLSLFASPFQPAPSRFSHSFQGPGKGGEAPRCHSPNHTAPQVRGGEVLCGRGLSRCLLQGLELCRVVAAHVENLLSAREKRLTLPPSEITLL